MSSAFHSLLQFRCPGLCLGFKIMLGIGCETNFAFELEILLVKIRIIFFELPDMVEKSVIGSAQGQSFFIFSHSIIEYKMWILMMWFEWGDYIIINFNLVQWNPNSWRSYSNISRSLNKISHFQFSKLSITQMPNRFSIQTCSPKTSPIGTSKQWFKALKKGKMC